MATKRRLQGTDGSRQISRSIYWGHLINYVREDDLSYFRSCQGLPPNPCCRGGDPEDSHHYVLRNVREYVLWSEKRSAIYFSVLWTCLRKPRVVLCLYWWYPCRVVFTGGALRISKGIIRMVRREYGVIINSSKCVFQTEIKFFRYLVSRAEIRPLHDYIKDPWISETKNSKRFTQVPRHVEFLQEIFT